MKCDCRNWSNDDDGWTFYVQGPFNTLVRGWIGDDCPHCGTTLREGWHR